MERIKDYLYLLSVLFDRQFQAEAVEEQEYEQDMIKALITRKQSARRRRQEEVSD